MQGRERRNGEWFRQQEVRWKGGVEGGEGGRIGTVGGKEGGQACHRGTL